MNINNYKSRALKKNEKNSKLKDKTIKWKWNCYEKYTEEIENLNESKINHHPSYYERQVQSKKKEIYEKNLEKKCKNILKIISNPSLIGLPKESKLIRPADVARQEEEKNRIDLLMEYRDVFYLISLKQRDNKTSRKRTKKSLNEISNFLVYDYGLRNLKLLYVRDNFKTDELIKDKFAPFNYAPNK